MKIPPKTFDEACEAWQPDLTPRPPQPIDVQQVIHALERARDRLQAEADAHAADDCSADFPAEDAERMREAITLLRGTALGAPVDRSVFVQLSQALGHPKEVEAAPGELVEEALIRMACAHLHKVNAIRKARR